MLSRTVYTHLVKLGAVTVIGAGLACSGASDTGDWPSDAVRAVLRRMSETHPDRSIAVDPVVRGTDGVRIPWSMEQAVITAGYVLDDPQTRAASAVVVSFRRPERVAGGWRITTVMSSGRDAAAGSVEEAWQVSCTDAACEVTDPVRVER